MRIFRERFLKSAALFAMSLAGTLGALPQEKSAGTEESAVFETKRPKAGRIITNPETKLAARINEICPSEEMPFPAEKIIAPPGKRKMIVKRLSENEKRRIAKAQAIAAKKNALAAKKEAALQRKAERDAREHMLFDEREREDAKRREENRQRAKENEADVQRAKDFKEYLATPVREMVAHPVSDIFPGKIPANAPRVNQAFKTDNEIREWQGTGLYAPPGEIIRVHVSTAAVGTGYRIRIGSHTDNLLDGTKKDAWLRFPAIVREFRVSDSTIEIANPFGGIIYINAPKPPARSKVSSSNQPRVPRYARFEFIGVVEMPFYDRVAKTKPHEWAYSRNAPAPWAEIAGKHFIATLPSADVRGIENPAAIVDFWDKTIDELNRLAGTEKVKREVRERIVFDADCTEFFAHGGGTIVLPLSLTKTFTDLNYIRENGSWALFFYFAKNRVRDEYALNGNKDAAAALLALALMEATTEKKPSELFNVPALHSSALTHPDQAGTAELIGAFAAPAEAFGWNTLAKALDIYNNAKKPPTANELEKAETFVTAWSRAAKTNLGPYFENFGIEYSKRLQGRLEKFKKFAPKNFPPALGTNKPSADCFLGDAPLGSIDVFFDDYRPEGDDEDDFIDLDAIEDEPDDNAESDEPAPKTPEKKKIRV